MSEEMLPQPAPLDGPPVLEPKSIKVFGVIHLVFGILGMIYALFSFALYIGLPLLLNWGEGALKKEMDVSDPGAKEILTMIDAMRTLFADLAILNWAALILSVIVSFLILFAGIALMKKRKIAVAKSNRYVFASLGAKVVNLILYFAIGAAANAKYQEAIAGLNPGAAGASGPGGLDMNQLQSMVSSGGAVLGLLLAAVYPILAYIFLNKPEVKEFLRNQGS